MKEGLKKLIFFINFCELIVYHIKYGFDDKDYLDKLAKKAYHNNPYVINYLKEQPNTPGLIPKASKNKVKTDAEWFYNLTVDLWSDYQELTDYIIKKCAQHQYSLDDYL